MRKTRSVVNRVTKPVTAAAGTLRSSSAFSALVDAVQALWAKLPIPESVRSRLARLRLMPGSREVDWDLLLLGGQCRHGAAEFAEASGQFLWPSTRFVDGPHVDLLEKVRDGVLDPADRDALLATPYADLGRTCIRLYGDYFGATDEESLGDFIADVASGDVTTPRRGRSTQEKHTERLPRVRRIRYSDCYEIVDGHHRLASMYVAGSSRRPRVITDWARSLTPLQQLLLRMSWLDGSHEIYQPIDSPELKAEWPLVRGCTDRWERIETFLKEAGVESMEGVSYLDVAAAQGWFVNQMHQRGADAMGVELDPLGPELASRVYGLPSDRITTDDAVHFLTTTDRTWDVVSCFSLIHHFALGRAEVSGERLVELLAAVTGRYLFIDTGEAHETWFAGQLDDWDVTGIEKVLREHGGFTEIHQLGRDHDARGAFVGNYSRMLFVAVKDPVESDPVESDPVERSVGVPAAD